MRYTPWQIPYANAIISRRARMRRVFLTHPSHSCSSSSRFPYTVTSSLPFCTWKYSPKHFNIMDKLEKSLEQEPLYQDVDLEHFQEKDQLVPIAKRSLLSGIFPPCFRWLAELWMLIIILVLLSLLRSRKCVEVMHRQAVKLENQYPIPERKYVAGI